MTMNMNGGEKGDGVLNITAENEGLDSELHLTVNGGNIHITSGNDGINTNEDYISVTTINGGFVGITVTGSTGEGDGIDSNGWLVINGGTVIASACATSGDAGIDSDMGIYLNGGSVCATGNMLDRIAGGSSTYAIFTFSERQKGGSTYTLKASNGITAGEWAPENDFTYLIVSGEGIVPGVYTLWHGGTQYAGTAVMDGFGGFGGMRPDGEEFTPPEGFDPESMTLPDDVSRPNGDEFDPPEMPEIRRGGRGQMGGFGGPGGSPSYSAELDTEFEIKDGGSTFINVSPIKTVTTTA